MARSPRAGRIQGTATPVKRKCNPITGLDRPRGFQEVKAPRFRDNGTGMVVGLSALATGRLYPPENTPGTQLC